MTTYQKNKVSILKWRESHIDEYREYQKNYTKGRYLEKGKEQKRLYYLKNKEVIKEKKLAKKKFQLVMQELITLSNYKKN